MSSSVISMASEMNLELPGQAIQESSSDRRADVDAKQGQMAELLARTGCEGLLVLDQANLAWLSAGGAARSVVMGIPGKVVRAVTDQELERTRRINAAYLELAQRYVRGAYPPPWMR